MAENYLQHAEHYWRILSANQMQQQYVPQQQGHYQQGNGGNRPQPNGSEANGAQPYSASGPSFSLAEEEEEGDAAVES
jgi:hypothetical protein